jgi:hypothetical protein
MLAVQLAKAFGASVTGVDDATKLDLIRSLGADHVIDYGREDFTRRDERYDLIVDIPGNHSFSECRRARPNGKYVLIGHDQFGTAGRRVLGGLPRFMKLMAISPFVKQLPRLSFSLPARRDSMAVLAPFVRPAPPEPPAPGVPSVIVTSVSVTDAEDERTLQRSGLRRPRLRSRRHASRGHGRTGAHPILADRDEQPEDTAQRRLFAGTTILFHRDSRCRRRH